MRYRNFTDETMLLLIALGALYRLFSKDYPEQRDTGVLPAEPVTFAVNNYWEAKPLPHCVARVAA